VKRLEKEADVDEIKDYFSFQHFRVIYSQFQKLDKDNDAYISKADLARHDCNGMKYEYKYTKAI
jgi:serine/threonine-protein phosphatase 2A regulatory subunit B''